MSKRIRSDPKNNSNSKSKTSPSARSIPFGQPALLDGEDAAAYDELHGRMYAAVKPVDVIEEMLIADVVSLEWAVLRWRRLKLNLIRALQLEALPAFLNEQFEYDLRSAHFVDSLADTLEENLPEDQAKSARTLAYNYIRDNADAIDKVNEIFANNGLDMDQFIPDVRAGKIEELVQEYVRRKPDAVAQIQQLLADTGRSTDALLADGLLLPGGLGERRDYLGYIERIDRLATIAENRRNAALREIDRRRAVLGQTLRRGLQEVEDAEFKVIETMPTKGKNTA
jgi:hypothetical protein